MKKTEHMKKYIYIILLFAFNYLNAQKKENILKKFDTSKMETSVLVQKSPLINIQDYQHNFTNVYGFFQTYKTIQQGSLITNFKTLSLLKNEIQFKQSIIPIGLLYSVYETIKKEAFDNGNISNDESGFLINNNPLGDNFNKKSIFISSPLKIKHKGLNTTFQLTDSYIFNTTKQSIKKIEIDFDDSNGYRSIATNQFINIHYTTPGKKKLITKITLKNGTILQSKSNIKIIPSNTDISRNSNRSPSNFTASITPDLSVYGESTSYPGQGEYEIFLSTEPGATLDKPIIILDGFDPFDARPIAGYTDGNGDFVKGIYELLDFTNSTGNTDNLADLIRAEGFDIVILNFPEYIRSNDHKSIDGGTDYIERNAMLLVDLINTINAQKTGNNKNVIIGPSMGGLISRYALNYMENNGLNHDTRLWISFDSPHLGANVPIGFQHQFNFLAYGLNDFWFIGNQNVEALQPIIDGFMKSPAARQMLVDHFEAHITNSDGVTFNNSLTLPLSHPFKDIFYNRLNALTTSGYPENLRKINIINGSGSNQRFPDKNGNDILPNRRVVDVDIHVTTGTDALLKDTFTPYAGTTTEVSDVYIDFAWYIPAFDVHNSANSSAHSYSNGIDAASGGLFDLGSLTEDIGSSGITGEFINALQTNYFNFIPTVSAMGQEFTNNQINWFQIPNNNNPFDASYMPTQNEPHVTLTNDNVKFAWYEILLGENCSGGFTIYNPQSNSWSNGLPNATKSAVLASKTGYETYGINDIGNSFTACNCQVEENVNLTINATKYIEVINDLTNQGNIKIENTGSFVQRNDLTQIKGNGTFEVNINTTSLDDANRYTYFSSPTSNSNLNVFNSWGQMNRIYDFNASTQLWNLTNGNENMTAGKGYIVRGNQNGTYPMVATTNFTSKFNNGIVTQPIYANVGSQESLATDDDSNLIGNPYPSPINADMLLTNNANVDAFYIWTHGTAANANGEFANADYAVWTLGGGTMGLTGKIASGQGFFAVANHSGTVEFNNLMRETTGNTDFRNQTYDKVWLNLKDDNDYIQKQILVSFMPQGTDSFDNQYDALSYLNNNGIDFYSTNNAQDKLAICVSGLLQIEDKMIPLGITLTDNSFATYKISIDHLDELNNTYIYLKDHLFNTITDLKLSDYSFNTLNTLEIDNRFELLFSRSALSINDIQVSTNDLIISNQNETQIKVKMLSDIAITKFEAFDSLGKLVLTLQPNKNSFTLDSGFKNGQVVFIKTTLENGQILNTKFIKQ